MATRPWLQRVVSTRISAGVGVEVGAGLPARNMRKAAEAASDLEPAALAEGATAVDPSAEAAAGGLSA